MAGWWAMWLTLIASSVSVRLARGAPSQMYPYDAIDDDPEEERWFGDGSFYDIDYVNDHPQADGTGVVELCPPVPKVLPTGGCDLAQCSSDRECRPKGLMCCYNGCVYTCLPQVLPAPYFDWIREPRRRRQYGQSWLVPGPDTKVDVEMCSTTPPDDDSDPLLCPHGYECVVDLPGNTAKGIPNTGHCVKTSDDGGSSNQERDTQEPLPKVESVEWNCKINESSMLIHGHSLIIDGLKCLCQEATLICNE